MFPNIGLGGFAPLAIFLPGMVMIDLANFFQFLTGEPQVDHRLQRHDRAQKRRPRRSREFIKAKQQRWVTLCSDMRLMRKRMRRAGL